MVNESEGGCTLKKPDASMPAKPYLNCLLWACSAYSHACAKSRLPVSNWIVVDQHFQQGSPVLYMDSHGIWLVTPKLDS